MQSITEEDEGEVDSDAADSPLQEAAVSPQVTCALATLTAFAAIGGFLFGYDTGVVSGAAVFVRRNLGLTPLELEVVVSITVGAAAIGAALSGYPMQRYGRRPIIMVASGLYAIGSICIGFAPGFQLLVVGRVILGLGVGLSSMSIPVYIAEVAPPAVRGKLVSCYNFFIVLGQASACGVNIVVQATMAGGLRWRVSMGLAAIPAIVQFIGFLNLPESPRWLAQVGCTEKARDVVRRVTGGTDAAADYLHDVSREAITLRRAIADFHREAYLRRIFTLGFGLMVLQQLSGINTIMYFGAELLIMCGFEESQAVALTAALATAQGVGVLMSMPLFDRVGRRLLILPSTLISATCLMIISIAFGLGIHRDQYRDAALFGIVVYLVAFGTGLSPGPWVVNSEIYPTAYRGLGNAGATTVNWLANYVVSALFLTACRAWSKCATFALLSAIAFSGALWLAVELPETAGKNLGDSELKLLFSRGPNATVAFSNIGTEDETHPPVCAPLAKMARNEGDDGAMSRVQEDDVETESPANLY